MIETVVTTPASVHDNQALEDLILRTGKEKAAKNSPLSKWEIRFNRLISKQRYVVERTFGSMKRWFKSGNTHYVGLAKTHGQHVLEAIAHNLYRITGQANKYLT